MTTALLPGQIDEELIKARINDTIARLESNEDIAEFYCELRAQVSLRRAQLETELLFETNFLKTAETLFQKRMEDAHAKRLPADGYEITLEAKTEKDYEADILFADLQKILPETEYAKAVFPVQTIKTNGTELNKLVRAYGPESNVARTINGHTIIRPVGRPKLKIERKER